MKEQYQTRLDELAAELVNPVRYQKPEMLGWGGEAIVTQLVPKPEVPVIVA